jgi:hypothetical protein
MPGGRYSKQGGPYLAYNWLNAANDSVIGGAVSTAPSGATNVSQWQQNLLGDRFLFDAAGALAVSNNTVGNLYAGLYQYVGTRNNSTSSPVRGRAAFWDLAANGTGNNISSSISDQKYQVTSDGNTANSTNTMFAGVFINNITAGNYGFIQINGKASLGFRAAITGTPAIGAGVYQINPAVANNSVDNGSFDVLAGANAGAGPIAAANFYGTIDGMITTHVGIAETLPSNNNISLVDLGPAIIRW